MGLVISSCVKDDVYGIPSIANITNDTEITNANAVTVTADITSLKGIKSATLYYKVNSGSYIAVNMTGTDTMTGIIPAQESDSVVTYYIKVIGNSGDQITSSEFSYTVGAVIIDYTKIVINEIDGNNKFIELYNTGDKDINLKGCYIEKDEEVNWTSTDITINANGYLLLYGEDVVMAGEDQEGYNSNLVFASGLSSKKDVKIEIFTPERSSISKFDLTKEDDRDEENSYSRNNNGKWYYATPTPGLVNAEGTLEVQTVNN